jgi:hypothetical protein
MLASTLLPGLWLSFNIILSGALRVSFYDDAHCQGRILGLREIDLGSNSGFGKCFQDFVGEARGACVHMTDQELGKNIVIDFYSSDTCDGSKVKEIIAETDSACVLIGGLGGIDGISAFRSFAAVSPGGFGKSPPFTDEEKTLYPGIGDGAIGHGQYWKGSDGRLWRYQQVAQDMLQAILAEEWDESIHFKCEKKIEYSNASPADGNGATFDEVGQ